MIDAQTNQTLQRLHTAKNVNANSLTLALGDLHRNNCSDLSMYIAEIQSAAEKISDKFEEYDHSSDVEELYSYCEKFVELVDQLKLCEHIAELIGDCIY